MQQFTLDRTKSPCCNDVTSALKQETASLGLLKSSAFWVITLCSLVKVSQHFEEQIASIFRLLVGKKIMLVLQITFCCRFLKFTLAIPLPSVLWRRDHAQEAVVLLPASNLKG
jgi:hypothetical protein